MKNKKRFTTSSAKETAEILGLMPQLLLNGSFDIKLPSGLLKHLSL